jgi:antitoxin component of MazEF toxin-antitoxin module
MMMVEEKIPIPENVALRNLVKRGGSLSVNLPTDWAKKLGWVDGTDLVLLLEDKEIRVCKIKSYTLASGRTLVVNIGDND